MTVIFRAAQVRSRTTAGAPIVAAPASSGSASQEWNIVTTGNGTYALVNKLSGFVLAASGATIEQQAPTSTSADWITPASQAQQWQLVPVHISTAAVVVTPPSFTFAGNVSSLNIAAGGSGKVSLTLTPTGSYTGTITMSCATTMANVSCSFSPASYTADGSDTVLTGSVTISSTSSSAMIQLLPPNDRTAPLAAILLLPGATILFWRRKQSRGTSAIMFLFALLVSVASLTACGGGGGGSTGGNGGGDSQPVTGTVTVTATSGNLTQSVSVSLTVQ